ncbi:MAG: alpha-glucosidase/alpha-galactosidase [Trueperaceae bacterium]|nr:alpha-glucosidase/alpha-galactosidase [Trueperaceae bacterium]
MTKITFIGGGSTVFAKALMGDLLSKPHLAHAELCLFDIDPERLRLSEAVGHRLADALGVTPRITATTDRERALDGADYALNMIQVGGYRPSTVIDFEIPARYGLRQTIGDTLGIGGIMRALRTIPVLLDIQRDMERLCPDVLHLNYANPMAMNCWALRRASPIRTIGLCHSVPHTADKLAHDAGVPADELRYLVAGINHMAFFLRLEHEGADLYPRLRARLEEGRVPDDDRVRYDLLGRFGYFVTESSEHLAEYVPWYLHVRRPDLVEKYGIPLDEYPRRCRLYEAAWGYIEAELREPGSQDPEALRQRLWAQEPDAMPSQIDAITGDLAAMDEVRPSGEYASDIIDSVHTGEPRRIYANVPNHGSIQGLPDDCCVEIPCLVDGTGVHPTRVGALPPQLTALMRTNVNVQELTVEAALSGRRDHVHQAALLDPHTAAELGPDEIEAMVDELLEAHADRLPEGLRPVER